MAEPRQEPPPNSRAGSVAGGEAADRGERGPREHGRGERSRDEHNRGAAARDAEGERSGPLLVERHRKADGRQLILYRRAAGDG
jgi:hypothetical protein